MGWALVSQGMTDGCTTTAMFSWMSNNERTAAVDERGAADSDYSDGRHHPQRRPGE